MQRLRFHTAGQHFSTRRRYRVVRTRQTGDGVEQNHYIMTALYQAFRLLVHDISDAYMVVRRFIEGRSNDLCVHAALHVGHFLRTLVDEQNNHIHLGVVLQYSVCQLFEQHRLTGLRLRYNQTALTFTDR